MRAVAAPLLAVMSLSPPLLAAPVASPGPAHRGVIGCEPLGQHRIGDTGCYIVAQEPLASLPDGPLYWHLDTFPDAVAANRARGANGTVLEAYGRTWLLSVAGQAWQPDGGRHVATIGPFRPLTRAPQLASYMVATSAPEMDSPAHTHAGPEIFYVVDGAQCLETPDGAHRVAAGQGLAVAGGVPMKLYGAGQGMRRALVLVLHGASEPVVRRNPDWRPTGVCLDAPSPP